MADAPAKRGRQPLTIHLSADELQGIQEAALTVGLSVQEYVLQCAKIMSRRKRTRHYTRGELIAISRERIDWTEDDVRDQGLPLHWAETWFRRQLAEGRTLREIAVQAGQPARSVSDYARRVYGVELREFKVADDVQEQAREMVASGMSREQVAAELGLSPASIGTYALGLPDERQKLLRARLEAAAPWPATTQEIGLRVFGGNADRAAKWAHEMLTGGHLFRAERGKYDLTDKWKTDTALTVQKMQNRVAMGKLIQEGEAGTIVRTTLSAEELVAQNLPPYWSTAWYREQYALAGKNFEEMARLTGYPPSTLRDFGVKYHGLRLTKPRRDEARRLVVNAWLHGERNKKQLAARYGVSIASVSNWTAHLEGHGDSFPVRKSRTKISAQSRLAMAGPFPATVQEVADRAFGSNRSMAQNWVSVMTRQGLLRRVSHGKYDQPFLGVTKGGVESSG